MGHFCKRHTSIWLETIQSMIVQIVPCMCVVFRFLSTTSSWPVGSALRLYTTTEEEWSCCTPTTMAAVLRRSLVTLVKVSADIVFTHLSYGWGVALTAGVMYVKVQRCVFPRCEGCLTAFTVLVLLRTTSLHRFYLVRLIPFTLTWSLWCPWSTNTYISHIHSTHTQVMSTTGRKHWQELRVN